MSYTIESLTSASGPDTQRSRGHLVVGTLASGREISIPYLRHDGAADGPCLWINAAVHGDEINGVMAALDFYKAVEKRQLSGSIIVTPVSNVLALDERRKTTFLDGIDMDQSFPGRADGFITERIAYRLFSEFGDTADVIVNLHTLGTPYDAEPYAVYKTHPSVPEPHLLKMIRCFEPTVACRMPVGNAKGELPGNIAGALDYQCLSRGTAAFMVELGGGGRLQPDIIQHGVDGFLRLARYIGLLGSDEIPGDALPATLQRVTRRAHKLVAHGGFFSAETCPGRMVPAGQRIGIVRNVFGDVTEEILAEHDSWVIATRRDPVVHSGDRVAFLATEWDVVDIDE